MNKFNQNILQYLPCDTALQVFLVLSSVRLSLPSFKRCLYREKLHSTSTDDTGIQIASQAVADSFGKQLPMLSQNDGKSKGLGRTLCWYWGYRSAIPQVAWQMDF